MSKIILQPLFNCLVLLLSECGYYCTEKEYIKSKYELFHNGYISVTKIVFFNGNS